MLNLTSLQFKNFNYQNFGQFNSNYNQNNYLHSAKTDTFSKSQNNLKNPVNFTSKEEIVTEYRPWGYFTVLEEQDSYKVKKIVVNPHHRLSLQLHNHRDENWVLVKGKAILRCDDDSREYTKGESITILRGQLHRIENTSDEEAVIVEIQNGEYLGEDDIVRFEDDYSRA